MIRNSAITLGRATASKIYTAWQMKSITLGEVPAMAQVAKDFNLKSKDVKDCIKYCTPKKPKKEIREFTGKATRKECDDLWAQAVKKRAGYKCEKTGETKDLQAHHIIPRTNYALRWDLENGICLTKSAHLFWAHHDGVAFAAWIKTKRNLDYLESKRHNRTKHDYQAIKIYLQNELNHFQQAKNPDSAVSLFSS